MSVGNALIDNFERDAKHIRALFQRADATGYLLLPTHLGQGVRTYAMNRFSEWCTANNAWCLVVVVSIDSNATVPLRERMQTCSLSTPNIRKWNVVNSALTLLAGENAVKNNDFWKVKRNSLCMIEYADRYEIQAFTRSMVHAVLDLLAQPEIRRFLTTFETRGRRKKA